MCKFGAHPTTSNAQSWAAKTRGFPGQNTTSQDASEIDPGRIEFKRFESNGPILVSIGWQQAGAAGVSVVLLQLKRGEVAKGGEGEKEKKCTTECKSRRLLVTLVSHS